MSVMDLDDPTASIIATYNNGMIVIDNSWLDKLSNAAEVGEPGEDYVSWDTLPYKPPVIAAGDDAASARNAIGAGTSSLALGTTASTAAAGNHTHAAVTTAAAGMMSAADKTKLDGIAAGANNYSLPAAGTALGGVRRGVAVSDAVADGELTTLNALLAALRTAGVIAP